MVYLPWPRVDPTNFKSIVPGAGVGTLPFGTGTNAMTMGLAILPSATVSATVVKIKTAPINVRL